MDKLVLTFAFLLNVLALKSQQVVANAGGYASSAFGSLSWTLGEGIIETFKGSNTILTQGFQQSKLIITDIKDVAVISLDVNVSPNPTEDFVILKVGKEALKDIQYVLYDSNGKILQIQKLVNNSTNVPLNNQSPGIYLLKVSQGNKEVRVFKIVKK